MADSPIRYLSAADVSRAMPAVPERLEIARRALGALASGASDVPPKVTLRMAGDALMEAMPGRLNEPSVLGMKWVAAFPMNAGSDVPQVNALIILNDPATGEARWLLDGSAITLARTAAVSMAAVELLCSPDTRRVVVLGYGAQARAHVEALAAVLAEFDLVVHGPDERRAEAFCRWAETLTAVRAAAIGGSLKDVAQSADLILSCASLHPGLRALDERWVGEGATVIAIDDDTYATPELASRAATFIVDDVAQFETYRPHSTLSDFPVPDDSIGGLLAEPRDGSMHRGGLAVLLGTAAADLSLAAIVAERATNARLGVQITR